MVLMVGSFSSSNAYMTSELLTLTPLLSKRTLVGAGSHSYLTSSSLNTSAIGLGTAILANAIRTSRNQSASKMLRAALMTNQNLGRPVSLSVSHPQGISTESTSTSGSSSQRRERVSSHFWNKGRGAFPWNLVRALPPELHQQPRTFTLEKKESRDNYVLRHASQSQRLRAHLGPEPHQTENDQRQAERRHSVLWATAVQASHRADTSTRRLTSSDAVSAWAMTCACQAWLEPLFCLQYGCEQFRGSRSKCPCTGRGRSFRRRGRCWEEYQWARTRPCRAGISREVRPALGRH